MVILSALQRELVKQTRQWHDMLLLLGSFSAAALVWAYTIKSGPCALVHGSKGNKTSILIHYMRDDWHSVVSTLKLKHFVPPFGAILNLLLVFLRIVFHPVFGLEYKVSLDWGLSLPEARKCHQNNSTSSKACKAKLVATGKALNAHVNMLACSQRRW